MKHYKLSYIYATKLWVAYDLATGLRVAEESDVQVLEDFMTGIGYVCEGLG